MRAEQNSPQTWTREQRRAIRWLPKNLWFLDDARIARRIIGLPDEGLRLNDEAIEWIVTHRVKHSNEVATEYGVKLSGWPPTFSSDFSGDTSAGQSLRGPRLPISLQEPTREQIEDKAVEILAEARCNDLFVFGHFLTRLYGLPAEMDDCIEWFLVTGDAMHLRPPGLLIIGRGHADTLPELVLEASGFSPLTMKRDWEALWPTVRRLLQGHGWKQPPRRRETHARRDWEALVMMQTDNLSYKAAADALSKRSGSELTDDSDAIIRNVKRLKQTMKPKTTLADMLRKPQEDS